ncbi:MAG TPA: hypothetical protein VEX38_01735, partial [Fimbriimonadaceae bacterium]|nr:hypothetical protein [Fimbriimonadaceae bacterium]
TFPITTDLVGGTYVRRITANFGTASKVVPVTLTPGFREFLLNGQTSATVKGGAPVAALVELFGPAPTGGATIAIIEDSSALSAPTSVQVPATSTKVNFTVTTAPVATNFARYIQAKYGSRTLTRVITLTP